MAATEPRLNVRVLLVGFAVVSCTFLLLDAMWLGAMASRLYRPAIGHIMREDFDVLAAAAFYAVYLSGVAMFVVHPSPSARSAFVRGACFGLVCYGTYDLTNQATVAGWPWHVTLVDLAWGALATAASAALATRVARA